MPAGVLMTTLVAALDTNVVTTYLVRVPLMNSVTEVAVANMKGQSVKLQGDDDVIGYDTGESYADDDAEVLARAIQVHGAYGMTDDTPLAYWYRHERGARIYDGPDEVHHQVVGRAEAKNRESNRASEPAHQTRGSLFTGPA